MNAREAIDRYVQVPTDAMYYVVSRSGVLPGYYAGHSDRLVAGPFPSSASARVWASKQKNASELDVELIKDSDAAGFKNYDSVK